MNANELADELDSMLKKVGLENNRVPTMLRSQSETIASLQKSNRQQQAEIEALKAELVTGKDESFDRTASHMAGEYVSYPAKTLTDGEIAQVWVEHTKIAGTYDVKDIIFPFARAILRKAQEK
jgi:preprotein translocase subunit SecB